MNNISGPNLTPNNYINNAQHTGMQRGATNITKNEDASLQNTDDSVQLSLTEGPKAGLNSGAVSDKNKTESRANNIETPEEPSESQGTPENKNTALVPYQAPEQPNFDAGNPGSNINPATQTPKSFATPEDMAKIKSFQENQQSILQMQQDLQQNLLQMMQQRQHAWEKHWTTMMNNQIKHDSDIMTQISLTMDKVFANSQAVAQKQAETRSTVSAGWTKVLTA